MAKTNNRLPAFASLSMPRRLWAPCGPEPRAVGTQVRRGEFLARGGAGFPAPAHGKIIGTERRHLLGGPEVDTVVLETQASHADEAPDFGDLPDPARAQRVREMLGRLPVRRAVAIEELVAEGIGADRWTSPDLLGQLRQVEQRPIDAVVCSALDLDPALPLQQAIAIEFAMEIAAGVGALSKLSGAGQGIIAVAEDTPPAGVAALRFAAAAASVRLFPLANEYPVAYPSLLIRRTFRRRLAPGKPPPQAGVLLLDAAAALAVGRWFLFNDPMTRVPLGVYDRRRGRATLLSVSIGTALADVLLAADVDPAIGDLRAGHFLRELPAATDAVVAAGELTVSAAESQEPPEPAACLRCGFCVDACPARIHPAGLLEAAQQQDPELAGRFGIHSCVDCGICSYVCPSRLPLLPSIRLLRQL